jgi:ferredoxin-NADP reductase
MLRRTRREAPFAEATLLYFNRSEASTVFASELAELATHGSIRVHSFVDEGSVPSSRVPVRRLSRELVAETVGDLTGYEVFVCAPSGFIELARAVTQELGVSPHRFHVESFRPPQLQRSSQPSTKHHRIRFLKSQREVTVDGNTTLLEAARSAGLDLPSGCERGLCKACVCPKVFGATETAGAVSDKPLRTTLCNSFPHSDVDLDA